MNLRLPYRIDVVNVKLMKHKLTKSLFLVSNENIELCLYMPKRGLNQGFDECLLQFDTRFNPLSHHGWIMEIALNSYFSVLQ